MRNENEPARKRIREGIVPKGIRLEIILPAATTLLALLLGAGLNSFESRCLERQKFEFDVLKYVIGSTAEDRRRLTLLCQFSDLGLIPDPNRRYHRAEINGVRACKPEAGQRLNAATTLSELRNEIGTNTDADGSISFEDGIIKVGGRVGNVRDPNKLLLSASKLERIEIVQVFTGNSSSAREIEDAARRINAQLVVDREGRTAQLENLFSNEGVVRVGLLNSGKLVFGTEKRGIGFQLNDNFGQAVPREEGVDFHQVHQATVGRQRLTQVQLGSVQRVIDALCKLGRAEVFQSMYVKNTAAMSQPGFQFERCH